MGATHAGGYGGGHGSGRPGVGRGGMGARPPRRGFDDNLPRAPHFPHVRDDHRHRHERDVLIPVGDGYPYYDEYPDEGYPPAEEPAPAERPSPRRHSGYCDVSNSYPQFCVWKDGP